MFNHTYEEKGEHHKLTIPQRCYSCKGTGIYTGMAERRGVGVVCNQCIC